MESVYGHRHKWIHVCFRGLPVCASITPVGWLPELADTCKTDVLFRVRMHNLINLFVCSFRCASFFFFFSPLTETLVLSQLLSHFLFSSLYPSLHFGVPVKILLFLLVIFTNFFHLCIPINLLLHHQFFFPSHLTFLLLFFLPDFRSLFSLLSFFLSLLPYSLSFSLLFPF